MIAQETEQGYWRQVTHKPKYPTPVSAAAAWKGGRHRRVILTATWHPPASPCFTGRANPHHTRHQVLLLILQMRKLSPKRSARLIRGRAGTPLARSAPRTRLLRGGWPHCVWENTPKGGHGKTAPVRRVHAEPGSSAGKRPRRRPPRAVRIRPGLSESGLEFGGKGRWERRDTTQRTEGRESSGPT